jgi:L-arabinose isomerase
MPGAREEILSYAGRIRARLEELGRVDYLGIVDGIKEARAAEAALIASDTDLVVIHAGTYGLSSNILPCLRRVQAPVVSLHLQPGDDFRQGSSSRHTLPRNAFSAGGEIGSVLLRSGRTFQPISGRLEGDPRPWEELGRWCTAAEVRKRLRLCNIGLLGNFYPGMCDIYVDATMLINLLGVNLEILEIADLRRAVEAVSSEEVEERLRRTEADFALDAKATRENLRWPARVAAGMEKLASEHELDALAFHQRGYPGSPEHKIAYSMTLGGSFLTARGVPCVAEGDVSAALAMLILGHLGGGASQAEVNVADFGSGVNYISHSGPGDYSIASGSPFLRWLDFFHGKEGSGVSCEFSLREGPVTLLSVTPDGRGGLSMICAEGRAVPGPLLQNGNVNTRVVFGSGIERFTEAWFAQGPSHHSAIGCGHHARELEVIARVLGLRWVQVETAGSPADH